MKRHQHRHQARRRRKKDRDDPFVKVRRLVYVFGPESQTFEFTVRDPLRLGELWSWGSNMGKAQFDVDVVEMSQFGEMP